MNLSKMNETTHFFSRGKVSKITIKIITRGVKKPLSRGVEKPPKITTLHHCKSQHFSTKYQSKGSGQTDKFQHNHGTNE